MTLTNRKRRYCSNECKRLLLHELWLAEGLLRALGTRFAAFSWSDTAIILQIFPYGADEVFCFSLERTASTKPIQNVRNMTQELSKNWWQSRSKNGSRRQASQTVLQQASYRIEAGEFHLLQEQQVMLRGFGASNLVAWRLTRQDLIAEDRKERIKKAYREQAKIKHPDAGGDAREFISIKEMFDSLKAWAENPTYFRQRSLPKSWVYHDERSHNRWSPPSGI